MPASAVAAPGIRPPMGIRAPDPQWFTSDDIRSRQRVEIRPGEPVFVFVPTRMGAGGRIAGLNKNSPFSIRRLSGTPPGVPGVRTMGTWYQISLKPDQKAGQRDQVAIVTTTVTLHPKETSKPFTLVSGSQRWY